MKTLISILILIFIVFSSSIALEPVRCAVCYTGGGAVTVDVQLHDYGTSTNVYPGTGNQNIGSLTANSSGVISFVIGSGDAAWTAISSASVTNNYMVNVYINGSIAAYLRLDELVVEQGVYGSSITESVISLPNGEIFVGDSNGDAVSLAVSGDATLNNAGELTVDGLQGRDVVNTAPADGQVLTWDNGNSQWEPNTPAAGGGGNAYGYVYEIATFANRIISENGTFIFSNNGPLSGISHTEGTDQIEILTTGTYKIDYSISSKFSPIHGMTIIIGVNGVEQESTEIPIFLNTSGQVSGSAMLNLIASDIITLKNNSNCYIVIQDTYCVGAQINIVQID
jgi:hypothetical protein